MGQILNTINESFVRLQSDIKFHDRTDVIASDYEAMASLLRETAFRYSEAANPDGELTEALCRRLQSSDKRGLFPPEKTVVYGDRIKKVLVNGVKMVGDVPGAEDIRRKFSAWLGMEMDCPVFELDGSTVVMTLTAAEKLRLISGSASLSEKAAELGGEKKRLFEGASSSPESRDGLGVICQKDSGDVINTFRTDDGRYYMLICDGMGTGREASVTARVCAFFTEKMICAGASTETTLKMLNTLIRARREECSSTVDLCEIDMMNGMARFVKSGAAPTYVRRDGRLFRLQSKTVPIGIVRALDAEMIKFELLPGDTVIMLSDGVGGSLGECTWLYEILVTEPEGCDAPESEAEYIIRKSVERGAKDDITVGIIRVGK